MSELERTKRIVVDYYQTAFNGDPEKAVAEHFGPHYVQHNPDAVICFVHYLRGEFPNLRLDIKRVIAEGDMVVTHSHLDLEPSSRTTPVRRSPTTSGWRTAR